MRAFVRCRYPSDTANNPHSIYRNLVWIKFSRTHHQTDKICPTGTAPTPEGYFSVKGSITVGFNRLVLLDALTLAISVKPIAAPKCKVGPDGRILGKGHAKRDAVTGMFPPLWAVDLANLPRRGPYPDLTGREECVLLRVMEDVLILGSAGVSTYALAAGIFRKPVHVGGDVVLVRKDGAAVCCRIRRNFDPIEPMSSKIKQILRSHAPQSDEKLLQAAKKAFQSISVADRKGFSFSGRSAT